MYIMYIYIYIERERYIHACMHTYMHTYIHTFIHTYNISDVTYHYIMLDVIYIYIYICHWDIGPGSAWNVCTL